jgi:hypothetical protein
MASAIGAQRVRSVLGDPVHDRALRGEGGGARIDGRQVPIGGFVLERAEEHQQRRTAAHEIGQPNPGTFLGGEREPRDGLAGFHGREAEEAGQRE